jgi:two-component system OmpR family sensor kinase
VADAAHELRSPLTALKLQAQALRRSDAPRPSAKPALRGSTRALTAPYAWSSSCWCWPAKKPPGSPAAGAAAPVALQDVVKLAVSDVLPHAHHKEIDLGVMGELPAQPVQVSGQDEALRILLRNLLDNAVKYTPAGGRVDVSTRTAGRPAGAGGQDSGPGIAPEDRERVFDRFFRAQSGAAGEAGESADSAAFGSGLGLAIVNTIAERHGATLQLGTSGAPGWAQGRGPVSRHRRLQPEFSRFFLIPFAFFLAYCYLIDSYMPMPDHMG